MTEPPLTFTANDWFYMKTKPGETCHNPNDQSCQQNQSAVNTLRHTSNNLGANTTQYNDSKMLYNRELLFTINILLGLALVCYYIYVNQSAIPSPSEAVKNISSVSNSIGNFTSSITNNLSMAPPISTTAAAQIVAK
jgi:hypothetical protein